MTRAYETSVWSPARRDGDQPDLPDLPDLTEVGTYLRYPIYIRTYPYRGTRDLEYPIGTIFLEQGKVPCYATLLELGTQYVVDDNDADDRHSPIGT